MSIGTLVKKMTEPKVAASGEVCFPVMKVVAEKPPIWKEVCDMIGAIPANTIFAWGDTIYNPDNIFMEDYLFAHEAVHQRQQHEYGGPEKWWGRYLDDVYFRLAQEVEAYAVQFVAMSVRVKDRNWQYKIKVDLARKLGGPLYGNSITNSAALAMLEKEIKKIS